MTQNGEIKSACEAYIEALFRAKERHQNAEGYWKDRRASKAYDKLLHAIGKNTPADLHWWYTIWELAGSVAERILDGKVTKEKGTADFSKIVAHYLRALSELDWIACLPLEHVFSAFPECTDFGDFFLVNANKGKRKPEAICQRFIKILGKKLNVSFRPADEIGDSYLRLNDHFFMKSGGYIPGRPQMILKVGRGDSFINKQLLSGVAASQLSLLALCLIAFEHEGSILEISVISPDDDKLPTGERMQPGYIEIPGVAVAINVNSGEAEWWGTQLGYYETHQGTGYDPKRFMRLWKEIAVPINRLRKAGLVESEAPRAAIENAIRLVARCRHPAMGRLTLNSVIATETILNPFSERNTPAEKLALFAAGLIGGTAAKRKETYEATRHLYNLRNSAVHESAIYGKKGDEDSGQRAFRLFLGCLKALTKWIEQMIAEGKNCSKEEFRELYYRTVL